MNTHDRLKHFGYAVEPGIFPAHFCDKIGAILDSIEPTCKKIDREMQVVLHCIHEADERLLMFVDDGPIFRVVQSVLNSGEQIILNSLSASRAKKTDDETFARNADAWRAHIDHRMPTPDFENTASICAMIAVDDMTLENGALRVWPFSHLSKEKPPRDQSYLPSPIDCVVPKGSVIYWLGQTWHSIGRNVSGARRWSIIGHWTEWWIKPTFNYAWREWTPALITDRQRKLLGYNSIPPTSRESRSHTVTELA